MIELLLLLQLQLLLIILITIIIIIELYIHMIVVVTERRNIFLYRIVTDLEQNYTKRTKRRRRRIWVGKTIDNDDCER